METLLFPPKKQKNAQKHKFGVDSMKEPVPYRSSSLSCLPLARLVLPLTSFLLIAWIWTFIFIIIRHEYFGNLKPKGSVHLSHSPNGRDKKKWLVQRILHLDFIQALYQGSSVLQSWPVMIVRIIREGNTLEIIHSNIHPHFFLFLKFIILFGCIGSSFLRAGFL